MTINKPYVIIIEDQKVGNSMEEIFTNKGIEVIRYKTVDDLQEALKSPDIFSNAAHIFLDYKLREQYTWSIVCTHDLFITYPDGESLRRLHDDLPWLVRQALCQEQYLAETTYVQIDEINFDESMNPIDIHIQSGSYNPVNLGKYTSSCMDDIFDIVSTDKVTITSKSEMLMTLLAKKYGVPNIVKSSEDTLWTELRDHMTSIADTIVTTHQHGNILSYLKIYNNINSVKDKDYYIRETFWSWWNIINEWTKKSDRNNILLRYYCFLQDLKKYKTTDDDSHYAIYASRAYFTSQSNTYEFRYNCFLEKGSIIDDIIERELLKMKKESEKEGNHFLKKMIKHYQEDPSTLINRFKVKQY